MEKIKGILAGDAAIFEMDYNDPTGPIRLEKHDDKGLSAYLTAALTTASAHAPVDIKGHISIAIRRYGRQNEIDVVQERVHDCLAVLGLPKRAAFSRIVRHSNAPPCWEESMKHGASTKPLTRFILGDWIGFAWRYYPDSCNIVGFVWFAEDFERSQVESLLTALSQRQHRVPHPTVFPLAILASFLELMEWRVVNMTYRVQNYQQKTGFFAWTGEQSGKMADNIDLGRLSAEVGGDACNWQRYQIDLINLSRICHDLKVDCESHALEAPALHNDQTHRYFQQQVQDMNLWLDLAGDAGTSLAGSASIISQGIFNLIAQRDSKANVAIARECKRDSTAMKAIAAVTMVFLPGTFIASFFAMPIFSINETTGALGAHQMWIYWAITIPLTIVTIGVWLLWSKLSEKRSGFLLQDSESASKRDV